MLRAAAVVVLSIAAFGLWTEDAVPQSKTATASAVLQQTDSHNDFHAAVEYNSLFTAPSAASLAGVSVRCVRVRSNSSGSGCGAMAEPENRISELHFKKAREALMLRLSPSRMRKEYLYSLRRLVI